MGKRLSKIYTRTGDDGTTGLGDGTRVPKDDPRVEAFGTVDELNATLGVLLAGELPEAVRALLTRVQHELFDLGSELCLPGYSAVADPMVDALERELDGFNAALPALEEFILPGGSPAAAQCHVARTVCRRAERRVATLARSAAVAPPVGRYLNRLSDLLFVLARVLARADGGGEVYWRSPKLGRGPSGA
jgi:cob(I)alamin adenosyltransferase